MLTCPNVLGDLSSSLWESFSITTWQWKTETSRSLLLRHFSCTGYFSIHSARKRAYGWFSSLLVRARIWERASLGSTPCFNEPDIEKLTMKAALLKLPAWSVQKSCVNLLNVEIVENTSLSLAYLFPFWVVAFEGQVFKLYLMTMARKSCVHKAVLLPLQ